MKNLNLKIALLLSLLAGSYSSFSAIDPEEGSASKASPVASQAAEAAQHDPYPPAPACFKSMFQAEGYRIYDMGQSTDGTYGSAILHIVDPKLATHYHKKTWERYIVQSGEVIMTLNGESKTLKPMDFAATEPGDVHSFKSTDPKKAAVLFVTNFPPFDYKDVFHVEDPSAGPMEIK